MRDRLNSVSHFVACFDESLNRIERKEQMDIAVRLWDINAEEVSSRYWDSVFLGHTRAVDLKNAFVGSLVGHDKSDRDYDVSRKNIFSKLLQVSMDGPVVNWSFLEKLKQEIRECDEDPNLVDCGSCGLHVVHGAFRTGADATGWQLDVVLRNLYSLFKKSPAKEEDFTRITGSDIFPDKFCACRWVENASKSILHFLFFACPGTSK